MEMNSALRLLKIYYTIPLCSERKTQREEREGKEEKDGKRTMQAESRRKWS
jgi:hypothetical protein